MEEENKRPRVTESLVWRPEASLVTYREAPSGKAEKTMDQTQNLIVRGTELEKSQWYAKIRALVEKGWISHMGWESSELMTSKS